VSLAESARLRTFRSCVLIPTSISVGELGARSAKSRSTAAAPPLLSALLRHTRTALISSTQAAFQLTFAAMGQLQRPDRTSYTACLAIGGPCGYSR
jgi:hypothetical protein